MVAQLALVAPELLFEVIDRRTEARGDVGIVGVALPSHAPADANLNLGSVHWTLAGEHDVPLDGAIEVFADSATEA